MIFLAVLYIALAVIFIAFSIIASIAARKIKRVVEDFSGIHIEIKRTKSSHL